MAWRAHAEAQPLRFIDRELFPHLVESTVQVAAVLLPASAGLAPPPFCAPAPPPPTLIVHRLTPSRWIVAVGTGHLLGERASADC